MPSGETKIGRLLLSVAVIVTGPVIWLVRGGGRGGGGGGGGGKLH